MTTVEFECPVCRQVCAFKDRYVGRRARCMHCSTRFLVPAAGKAAVIVPTPVSDDEPFSGFWKALLIDTRQALLHPHSIAGIGTMVVLSLLRYSIGHPLNAIVIVAVLIPFGILTSLPTVLFQCWYLIEIIQSTIEEGDPLPVFVGKGWMDRFYGAILNTYMLLMLTAICLAPALLLGATMDSSRIITHRLVLLAAAGGVFFLPLSLTIFAYTRDMLLCFRLDRILRAAKKAFWPHMTLVGLTAATLATLAQADFYARNAAPNATAQNLLLHTLATVLAMLTARTAGLFYRHYGCYLP